MVETFQGNATEDLQVYLACMLNVYAVAVCLCSPDLRAMCRDSRKICTKAA